MGDGNPRRIDWATLPAPGPVRPSLPPVPTRTARRSLLPAAPALVDASAPSSAQGNWDREREHQRAPGTAIRSFFGTDEQEDSPQHAERFKDGDTRGWFLGMDSGPNRYATSPGGGGGRGGGGRGGGAEVGGMNWSSASGGSSPPLGITGETQLDDLVPFVQDIVDGTHIFERCEMFEVFY